MDCCQYEVKSDVSGDPEIAAKQIAYISNYTEQALHALKSGSQSETEKYIDIPSLVDNYLANELCKNVDAGWDSYYFSKDAGGKLTFHPMWDYDLALGNNTEAKGISDAKGLGIFDVTDSSANSNPCVMRSGATGSVKCFRHAGTKSLLKSKHFRILYAQRRVPTLILTIGISRNGIHWDEKSTTKQTKQQR